MIKNSFLLLMVAIAAIGLFSCDTAKRAERRQAQILRTHPNVAMVAIRKIAPCITTGSSTTFDSSGFKYSLDSIKEINDFYINLVDNIEPQFIHDTTRLVEHNCEGYKQNEYVYKNKIYVLEEQNKQLTKSVKNIKPIIINNRDTTEDLSKVVELDNKLTVSDKKIEVLQAKVKGKNKVILWLIIFLVGLSIPYIIKIVKLFTLPKIPI